MRTPAVWAALLVAAATSAAALADERTMRDRCRQVDAPSWSTSHSFSHGASIVTCTSDEVVLGTACHAAKGQCGTAGAFDGPYSYACILSAPKDCADSVRAEAMCCR
jgi:hypothetical protein